MVARMRLIVTFIRTYIACRVIAHSVLCKGSLMLSLEVPCMLSCMPHTSFPRTVHAYVYASWSWYWGESVPIEAGTECLDVIWSNFSMKILMAYPRAWPYGSSCVWLPLTVLEPRAGGIYSNTFDVPAFVEALKTEVASHSLNSDKSWRKKEKKNTSP